MSFIFASEIGPGFSPDIKDNHKLGFSPWDMLFFYGHGARRKEDMSQAVKVRQC